MSPSLTGWDQSNDPHQSRKSSLHPGQLGGGIKNQEAGGMCFRMRGKETASSENKNHQRLYSQKLSQELPFEGASGAVGMEDGGFDPDTLPELGHAA